MSKRITQRDRVLQYCRDFGSITSYQAYVDLGITQLGARVWELKNKYGYKFKKERVAKENRYGDMCHFDKYILVED